MTEKIKPSQEQKKAKSPLTSQLPPEEEGMIAGVPVSTEPGGFVATNPWSRHKPVGLTRKVPRGQKRMPGI